jgi:hypothetical protein
MINNADDSGSLGYIRVVGSSSVIPTSLNIETPELLVYNMGLGSESRGLYIQIEDDKYVKLAEEWTYVKLTSAYTTTSTAPSSSPLAFTPLPNSHYLVEGCFFLQSAVTTTGVRPGLSWPTGTTQEAAWMISPSSATAFSSRFWGAPGPASVAATAVAVANEGFLGKLDGQFVTEGSVSGDFAVTLTSETNGTEVRLMENSWIRYKTLNI